MDNPRPADLGQAGALLVQALVELARERPEVRAALRSVVHAAGNSRAECADPRPVPLVDKVLTPSRPGTEREGGALRQTRRIDLSVVVRRARWKAAACRLAIDKRAAGADDEQVRRLEDKLRRKRSDLEDCWAWMFDSPRPLPEDPVLAEVASCYDTVALAAESALALGELGALSPKPPSELLYLLAEAQSALLSALHKCDLRGDSDQRDLFLWLKDQTTRHRIYVDRHMRLDDPADSKGAEDLAARLAELVDDRAAKQRRVRARSQLLAKLRYHQNKAREAGAPSEQDLGALEAAAEEWEAAGIPPGDAEFAAMARELTAGTEGQALGPATARAIAVAVEDDAPAPARRDSLAEVRPLLDGRRALVLGSAGDVPAPERLCAALGLVGLRFVALPREGVGSLLAAEIGAPDTDLVMIATRLPEDEYAEFKRLCLEADRPFVRLSSGLEPPHVAHQVLRQVAWRLRQAAPR